MEDTQQEVNTSTCLTVPKRRAKKTQVILSSYTTTERFLYRTGRAVRCRVSAQPRARAGCTRLYPGPECATRAERGVYRAAPRRRPLLLPFLLLLLFLSSPHGRNEPALPPLPAPQDPTAAAGQR